MMTREEQEKAKAEAIIKRAYEQTPEEYHQYIIMINTPIRIGGTKEKPIYTYVDRPYMQVDGRVKWAVDEANMQGEKIHVEQAVFGESAAGQLLCSKRVVCSRGDSVGIIEVNVGGGGADRYNAYANAETSALGRALGFLGYGLFGTGIASYEEMQGALSRSPGQEDKSDIEKLREVATEPVTEPQKGKIRYEAKKLDWSPGETEAAIDKIPDKKAAIAFIDAMTKGVDPRIKAPQSVEEADRKIFWAKVREAGKGKPFMDAMREEIKKRGWDPEGSTGKLSQDQRDQLIQFVAALPQPEITGFNAAWQPVLEWAKNVGITPQDLAAYVLSEYRVTYPDAKTPADLPSSVAQSYVFAIRNESGASMLFDEITDTLDMVKSL